MRRGCGSGRGCPAWVAVANGLAAWLGCVQVRDGVVWLRSTARYTVDRPTPNSSASSAVLCSPAASRCTRCASWRTVSLGLRPRKCPLALATLMPSRVRSRIRADSNSATIANTLNSNRLTGSVGSYPGGRAWSPRGVSASSTPPTPAARAGPGGCQSDHDRHTPGPVPPRGSVGHLVARSGPVRRWSTARTREKRHHDAPALLGRTAVTHQPRQRPQPPPTPETVQTRRQRIVQADGSGHARPSIARIWQLRA